MCSMLSPIALSIFLFSLITLLNLVFLVLILSRFFVFLIFLFLPSVSLALTTVSIYTLFFLFCPLFLSYFPGLLPRSNFILRHPITKDWIHTDIWHYSSSQSVYLACQSTTGLVHPITKISGLPLDADNIRLVCMSVLHIH